MQAPVMNDIEPYNQAGEGDASPRPRSMYRHALPTRIAHWLVVLCLPILAMSGLQIFNAHPALYWGSRSDPNGAWLELGAVSRPTGEVVKGITRVFGREIDTTGILGASRGPDNRLHARGFPAWATIPSERWLALGRRWHFFFAWIFALTGLGFGCYAVLSGHLARDLLPGRRDLRRLPRTALDHLRFHLPSGEAATRYNPLQRLAYTVVNFGLGGLIGLTGLAMSPRVDAALPFVVWCLGGRQSARTLHFLVTFAFVGFTVTHLFMIAVTGFVNNVRSIVTGWYGIPDHGGGDDRGGSD